MPSTHGKWCKFHNSRFLEALHEKGNAHVRCGVLFCPTGPPELSIITYNVIHPSGDLLITNDKLSWISDFLSSHLLISAKDCLVHNILSKYHSAGNRGQLSIINLITALFICLSPPLGNKLPEGRHHVCFPPFIPCNRHSAWPITGAQRIPAEWIH